MPSSNRVTPHRIGVALSRLGLSPCLMDGSTIKNRQSLLLMSQLLFFLMWVAAVPAVAAQPDIWTVIAVDPKGDGRDPSLADAAQLSYRYDKQRDMLWVRVSLYGKPNKDAFGVNIVVDTGVDDAGKMNWWGANKDFKFDKLLTAWVVRANGGYQGTIGVADAAGAKAKNLNNVPQNNLQIRVEGDSVLIGVKRTGLTDKMKMNLIAALGSNQVWNDDIPNTRPAVIDLSALRPARGLREIDVDRNNFHFPADYKTLAENEPPLIVRRGSGHKTMILIPGIYSGKEVFDGFIARNQSQYEFYVLTPPGLYGTSARPLPPETTSYGEFTWTRRLERDIEDLVRREKLNKPVIVAHGFPGSLAAEELAIKNPNAISGVIEISSMPIQFSPSPRNPKTPATPDERIEVVNEGWAQKWFKYVTPETWESNNYPSEMFANDPDRAEHVRRQVEAVPLPVKIRYLAEFMASDHSAEFSSLNVPMLVLRPGFNDKLLADPAYGWLKTSFQDSWNAFSKNPRIEVMTVPNARALILEDQPKLTEDAIVTFVERLRGSRRIHNGTRIRQRNYVTTLPQ